MKKEYFCRYYWHTLVHECVKQLDDMIRFYDDDETELCNNLIQCSELGHKLLEFDYHTESNKLADKVDDLISNGDLANALKEDLQWEEIYMKEHEVTKNDLKEFFKLLGKYSGELL